MINLLVFISVDSQTMDLGSNDTSNDFDYDNDRDDYVASEPSVASGNQGVGELSAKVKSMDLPTFLDHVKGLEAKRMANADDSSRMAVSDDSDVRLIDRTHPLDQELPEDEPWIDPIQRQIRSQEEEEMANAGTGGRLTAPRNEVRPRRARSNQHTVLNDSQLIDELRQKQLTLVNEQIYLQKILQENASIAQEEARERLMHIQIQRKIAEIELKQKEESMKK